MFVRPMTTDHKVARALADELRELRRLGEDRRVASIALFRKTINRLASPHVAASPRDRRAVPA